MEQKQLLLFGECKCANTLTQAIDQYRTFKKIYSKIELLIVVFEKDNYGISIDLNDNNIHILYLDINEIINKTVVRNVYNKYCNEEVFASILNHVFDELQKNIYNHIDYIVYFLNTTKNALPINKIIQIVHKNMDFDIVFSNDITNPMFINAYRSNKIKAGIEIYGHVWENELKKQIQEELQNSNDEYIEIYSGFGTISIINKKSINNVKCSCIPEYSLDYYYRTTCNDIIISTEETLNGILLGMYIFENSSIFYLFNQCLNYPTVHPFVNLCFNIGDKKKSKFYVCKTLLSS